MKRFYLHLFIMTAIVLSLPENVVAWQIQNVPIKTRFADAVGPDNVLPEYPRPQMVRLAQADAALSPLKTYAVREEAAGDDWINLNGLWDFHTTTSLYSAVPTSG